MNGPKSIVTGGSGYIALELVAQLLEDGHTVHATVRSLQNDSKCRPLRDLQAKHPNRLELFEADLLVPESFHAAMAGCSTVYHVASPFLMPFQIKNGKEEIVEPILRGIRNVLETVNETESVKRVVLESALSAVFGDLIEGYHKNNHTLTEADWNQTSTERSDPYAYSKLTAEREAWKMCKAQSRWTLVAVCSSFVIGPSRTAASSSGSLWTMNQLFGGADRWGCLDLHLGWVDVRDLAHALIRAGAVTRATGRYIVSSDRSMSMLEMADIVRPVHRQPGLLPNRTLPNWLVKLAAPLMGISREFMSKQLGFPLRFDNTRGIRELGLRYRPLKETVISHYETWAAFNAKR